LVFATGAASETLDVPVGSSFVFLFPHATTASAINKQQVLIPIKPTSKKPSP
jgi:hypothetical protein